MNDNLSFKNVSFESFSIIVTMIHEVIPQISFRCYMSNIGVLHVTTKASKKQESTSEAVVTSATESKPAFVYTLTKPQWLGAVDKKETKNPQEALEVEEEADEFVDYKDRKEIFAK
ncbi:hypothetical protein Tco_1035791 [Tanacetum coccineum]